MSSNNNSTLNLKSTDLAYVLLRVNAKSAADLNKSLHEDYTCECSVWATEGSCVAQRVIEDYRQATRDWSVDAHRAAAKGLAEDNTALLFDANDRSVKSHTVGISLDVTGSIECTLDPHAAFPDESRILGEVEA